MKLKIEIDLDNDAFRPQYRITELKRLFMYVANSLRGTGFNHHKDYPVILSDINGNTVGKAEVTE